VITCDTALCAGLRGLDLSYRLPTNFRNQKDIYQMTTTEQKEEIYNRVYEMMVSTSDLTIKEKAIQEIAFYMVSQLIQEREVIFYSRGIESGSYWQEVKAEIQKDILNLSKPTISQLEYNLNRDRMADDHYELGGEG
jgi:hypothetical protein